MTKRKLSKYDEKYIKNNYVTEFKIDDEKKKIYVYYIDGTSYDYPLTSQVLESVKKMMRDEYNDWRNLVQQVYMFNPVKLIYLNMIIRKQKYYLEHENVFNNCSIKRDSLDSVLSKKEIQLMKISKKLTHSYFNLATVQNYKLSTMKKIHRIISVDKKKKGSSKKR